MNDLIIKNGSIISAEGAFRSDIEIRQGKIYRDGEVLGKVGRTRAAIRGFIKYLIGYEQSQRKKSNPEP